jgi:hypothetical protein
MTKTELNRLARLARSLPYYRESATVASFSCPLDVEAKRREHDRTVAHRFTVPHLPWNTGTTAPEVLAALADHLDPDAEACSRVTR